MPMPDFAAPGPALPEASEEALTLARQHIHRAKTIGGDYRRISYRPPGVAPGGPDLLYRAAAQGARADEDADYLARLLAPLVDVALARGRAAQAARPWSPDGPCDAPPPTLSGSEVHAVVEDDGEVG